MFKNIMRSLGYVPQLEYDRAVSEGMGNKARVGGLLSQVKELQAENEQIKRANGEGSMIVAKLKLDASEAQKQLRTFMLDNNKLAKERDELKFAAKPFFYVVDQGKSHALKLACANGATPNDLVIKSLVRNNKNTISIHELCAQANMVLKGETNA